MMSIQVCLLVSDDQDDHQAISEALSSISSNAVVLNIIDSQKALQLLKHSAYQPDHLILDLSMYGIKVNSILKTVRDSPNEIRLPILLYGTPGEFYKIENNGDLLFFDKDIEYSELKNLLSGVFK